MLEQQFIAAPIAPPRVASQSLATPFWSAVATLRPSGLNRAALTVVPHGNSNATLRFETVQIRARPSRATVRIRFPSELNSADVTAA
jgi:hypothetical protein